MNFTDYFSASYSVARERFRQAARVAGATALVAYEHPVQKGPDGESLSVDVAHLGNPRASRQLLLISGTHGQEGYAGSAAQVAWLKSGDAAQLPPDVGVLLVHGINPYGFAYGTRTTENNVDLNRNFVDHDQPYPANPGYEALGPHLVPADWSEDQLLAGEAREREFAKHHGDDALFETLARGQYTDPDGLIYGGTQREWSNLTLEKIVHTHLVAAEKVGLIDWHTGIGERGEPFFLCFNEEGSALQAQAARWWGTERVIGARPNGLARPNYQGLVFYGVQQFLQGRPLAGAVIEFGTRGKTTGRALRLDQWLRRHATGLTPDARHQLHADVMDALNPVAQDWRTSVANHGLALTRAAAQGLATW
ncbi:MAG: M14 family metallopeptidase [Rhodoferax sp.]